MYIQEDVDQRYGRNKKTQINHSYINSSEYRRKFNDITDSRRLNRLIYEKAKEMLNHRSGTLFEDMYWFDYETESIICSKLDEIKEQTIRSTETIDNKLKNYSSVIPIHTHPSSLPPSPADFNCLAKLKYDMGVVLCHDGKVIIYTADNSIDNDLWEKYVQDFRSDGYNEYESQIMALSKFKDNGDIDFWEV